VSLRNPKTAVLKTVRQGAICSDARVIFMVDEVRPGQSTVDIAADAIVIYCS
jgi:hypothetical protein